MQNRSASYLDNFLVAEGWLLLLQRLSASLLVPKERAHWLLGSISLLLLASLLLWLVSVLRFLWWSYTKAKEG